VRVSGLTKKGASCIFVTYLFWLQAMTMQGVKILLLP